MNRTAPRRMNSSASSSAPSGGNNSNGPNSNPFLESYRAWSERTPWITRVSTIIVLVSYVLSFFLDLEEFLANIPQFSIFYFEFYRIFLSPLVGNSFIFLLIMLLSYPGIGLKMESSSGSALFLSLILTIDVMINLVFIVLCFFLYFLGTADALEWKCMDFWIILFALISIDCFLTPDTPRRLLCLPVDIPSKYMPLALYGLMVLFSFQLFIPYALSILFGYLFTAGWFDKLRPSSAFLARLEAEGGLLHSVSRSSGWVLAGTTGHDSWIPVNAGAETARSSHQPADIEQPSGFGRMFGRSQNNYQPLSTNDDSQHSAEMFPGSGHKLAPNNASSSIMPAMSITSSSTDARVPSREEIAARRLAALNDNK